MAETIGDFFDALKVKPQFSASPWYNEAGDCIHYHVKPDEFYGDRIDDKLTLYKSRATDEVVGCQIKGISALVKKFGDFGLCVKHEDGVELARFVVVSHVIAENSHYDQEKRRQIYLYVLERLGKARVTIPEETIST